QPRLVVAHVAGGVRDVRQRPHPWQERLGEGRHVDAVALPVLEGGLARDHDVRVLVRLLEERVEGGVDRVRQDVAPADHRDAEDDREGGQHGAQLAPGEPAQGDERHSSATSSVAMITSCSVERPRSLTIRRSASPTCFSRASYQSRSGFSPAIESGRRTFSSADSIGSRLKNWKTKPMCLRRSFVRATSLSWPSRVPATTTYPSVGRSSAASRCISVDFPDPDGPITAVSLPRVTSRSTPRSASTAVSPSP